MKNLLNIRIPSFVGIVLLLIGVGVTSFLVDQGIILEGRAAPEEEPTNIAITNVSPTGFSVIYTTDAAVPGTLKYGTDSEGSTVAYDDRDKQNGKPMPSQVHHLSITDLKPDTTYYFSILSGDTLYKNDGEPYEITTAPDSSEAVPENTIITGTVTLPETLEDKNLLVLLTSDETEDISTIVTADGTYALPTTGIRNKDLSSYVEISGSMVWNMSVLNHDVKSEIKVLAENTNPVPLILFGQSYDYTLSTSAVSAEASPEASGSAESDYPDANAPQTSTKVAILAPEERETFTDEQPLFQGTGVPGEDITILIQSDPITATVPVGTDGSWEFRPETPLEQGNHTVTITTKDITGTLQTFKKSFTVFAQGSQFIEPSVSPTRTPTPSLALISDTPTPSTTGVPSVSPIETPTPTVLAPTATPTQVVTQPTLAPTGEPMKPSGPEDTLLMILVGVMAVACGAILFFMTKGSTV